VYHLCSTALVIFCNPRTKPRACNFGLIQSLGQYVVIFNAEDVPDPLQLKKAVLTFANHGPNLACVQAKLNFYNPDQNLLTRWFTAEYSLWFDLILPRLQKAHFLLPLGGTSNHFPTQMIRALGGWDAFNVTEDCDLGLRLAWFKMEAVVLDSTTYEEAKSRTKTGCVSVLVGLKGTCRRILFICASHGITRVSSVSASSCQCNS